MNLKIKLDNFFPVEQPNQLVSEHSPVNTVSNSVNKIPIHSTVLSALAMVPYTLVLLVISSSNLSKTQIGLSTRIFIQLQIVFRCPLVALLAFKFNKKQKIENKNNLRTVRPANEVPSISSNN
jgi:hypothetical protein